jgi:serine protease SohB
MFNNLEAKIEVIPLNEQYDRMKQEVDNKVDNHKSGLSLIKSLAQIKLRSKTRKNNVFVIDFKGDKYASQSNCLAKEVSAILGSANKDDKVIVRLHSRGGKIKIYT